MNRIVLIGNGFDLAHGLKTSYADFFNWYKEYRVKQKLCNQNTNIDQDELCTFKLNKPEAWSFYLANKLQNNENVNFGKIFDDISQNDDGYEFRSTKFFKRIQTSIETKGWVDIENEYYELLKQYAFPDPTLLSSTEPSIRSLNRQLDVLKKLLCKYLMAIGEQKVQPIPDIADTIYAPIKTEDLPTAAGKEKMKEHVDFWSKQGHERLTARKELFGIESQKDLADAENMQIRPLTTTYDGDYPLLLRLPSRIMLLNFNYTNTPLLYFKKGITNLNYIHGSLDKPDSIIFGYGDELDERFNDLKNHKNNDCSKNIKSLRYLEASNYGHLSSFIESEPFQILIMGHSCGNSDRTLLNTMFEHKNCVSIKPCYYQKHDGSDDYTEKVLNISRNFNDMKLMRDRVVNKEQCNPLVRIR